jgi:DNA-binding transcriptional LysR family regulator
MNNSEAIILGLRNMDLAALQIFRTVVAEGGIARAATKLHRVQSNVTTRVKQLEASLGVELFVRDGKRLVLSPAGKVLLDYAERILHLAGEAKQAVKSEEPSGRLRVGSMESTAASRLPPVLSAYHKHYSAVRLELATGTTMALIRGVLSYELDAAFVADPVNSAELETLQVFEEELVIVTHRDHAPVRSARDMAGKTLLAFETGCAYRKRLEEWLAAADTVPQQVLELGSYHAILACVAAGTGVAVVPRSVVELHRTARGVDIHPLPARLGKARTLLIWRRNYDSAALRALVGQLQPGR